MEKFCTKARLFIDILTVIFNKEFNLISTISANKVFCNVTYITEQLANDRKKRKKGITLQQEHAYCFKQLHFLHLVY